MGLRIKTNAPIKNVVINGFKIDKMNVEISRYWKMSILKGDQNA